MRPEDNARDPVPADCDACQVEVTEDGAVLRCACGSLLARYVDGQVELKCRRCKRKVLIPIAGLPQRGGDPS